MSPPRHDLYADLGVERGATPDELNAAFRARAKDFHPDAQPGDPEALERFKRVSHAYTVLRDPVSRARYDARTDAEAFIATTSTVRPAAVQPPVTTPVAPPAPRWQLSIRGARRAVVGGVVLVIVGILAAVLVVGLQRDDASLRSQGIAATAVVVDVNGDRRLEFTTRSGEVVRAVESTKSGTEEPALGDTVAIHYDGNDPSHVVVDTSHTARDVTLWIVAVKLVVGGLILAFWGARRLRHPAPGRLRRPASPETASNSDRI